MSNDALKIKRKLSALSTSLDDLESGLSPLLSQPLPELVAGLDAIQQAKLQVVIPYLVYDLVFEVPTDSLSTVYLKTRGLDPKTHPVIAELDRVRQYFDKIKDAEDPAKRQLAIDKAAATRFIKQAIARAKDATTTPISVPGPSSVAATHVRFADDDDGGGGGAARVADVVRDAPPKAATDKMLEREKYHKALREEDASLASEDGGDLEVIDDEQQQRPPDDQEDVDGDSDKPPSEGPPPSPKIKERSRSRSKKGKGKGKEKAKAVIGSPLPDVAPAAPSEIVPGKRRRPPVDPFAGMLWQWS
ncbi:hypothetical protein F5148DRAFT_1369944 [Russula earlei]|uniref:Uncharacterized protein n=1 Tax=Russula earlei TaxID=71964 RepID=A0ACC0TZK6_9AGAM|nr:hypothetical protein F5148DRAFT_1369944 [Russula earlei]